MLSEYDLTIHRKKKKRKKRKCNGCDLLHFEWITNAVRSSINVLVIFKEQAKGSNFFFANKQLENA